MSVSTAGTTTEPVEGVHCAQARPPRQGPGTDGGPSLPGRCVPFCPYHSPSRALSTGTSEPRAGKVLSKQTVAFRESHKFRTFAFPAEKNGNEAA